MELNKLKINFLMNSVFISWKIEILINIFFKFNFLILTINVYRFEKEKNI
jgi:hypothetical protein